MARYALTLVHGKRDAHDTYHFDSSDDLITGLSPVKVMREALGQIEAQANIGHIDYELFSALKNSRATTVTALGNFKFHGDDEPFTAFVTKA